MIPTRRSTYQKIYKTRFQGTQVEALKDIHFTVEKGGTLAIMGNQDPGNRPSSISWPCWISRPKGGSTSTVPIPSTIKNKDASSFRREKLGFCLSRLQPAGHLVRQGQYPSPLWSSPRRPVKENDD